MKKEALLFLRAFEYSIVRIETQLSGFREKGVCHFYSIQVKSG